MVDSDGTSCSGDAHTPVEAWRASIAAALVVAPDIAIRPGARGIRLSVGPRASATIYPGLAPDGTYDEDATTRAAHDLLRSEIERATDLGSTQPSR
jgi:hypothetical protein